MAIKILHAADLHMDSPFDNLPEHKASIMRREQRELLRSMADICREEQVQVILLAGDLLDSASSYYETQDALLRFFEEIDARVFIAPGNHDYYCSASPYSYSGFPKNVHIFKKPELECVYMPELSLRVWGAGFNDSFSGPLLTGFKAPPEDGMCDIMVLHGDTAGGGYNRITEQEIAASGLAYLALGHIHTFSGIKKAGSVFYAYPGCPQGRGFDETGDKGVILGTVDKAGCDLKFIPLGTRRYMIYEADMSGCTGDAAEYIRGILPQNTEKDICRVILTGEYEGRVNLKHLTGLVEDKFFHLTMRDATRSPYDIWEGTDEDTLKGAFLRNMRGKYDSAPEDERELIIMAVRYGLSALSNMEEP